MASMCGQLMVHALRACERLKFLREGGAVEIVTTTREGTGSARCGLLPGAARRSSPCREGALEQPQATTTLGHCNNDLIYVFYARKTLDSIQRRHTIDQDTQSLVWLYHRPCCSSAFLLGAVARARRARRYECTVSTSHYTGRVVDKMTIRS